MAETIGGAVRELIIAANIVGGRVWSTSAPDRATRPYITIHDAVSTFPELKGDGRTAGMSRQVQIDLWEGADEEDFHVARALYAALNGQRLNLPNQTVMRVSVEDTQRIPEPSTNIAHRALTLTIRHDPAAY